MKLFDSQTIKAIDSVTIERQNISSLELMEQVALLCFEWICKNFPDNQIKFHVFCGVGNNGGDGLAIARMLKQKGYQVRVYIVPFSLHRTIEFEANLSSLIALGIHFQDILVDENFPEITKNEIIIDAIFGIGLQRELSPELKQLIHEINKTGAKIISVDVPSGMFLNRKTEIAVQAHTILTFQFPKTAFYQPENSRFFQKIEILNIGLDSEAINSSISDTEWIDKDFVSKIYKPVTRNEHKGTRGHAVLIGGSYGKIGAMVLASKAAIKSGCGLASAVIPQCGYAILQTAIPEVMVITPGGEDYIDSFEYDVRHNAIAIGMGLDTKPETITAFHAFLKQNKSPLLLDADALNILALNKDWFDLIPEKSILTPHPGELKRIIGDWKDDFDKIEKARIFSKKHKIILLIKGAFTHIIDSDIVFINSSGNQALATGGSGDVLSGVITALIAQGYNSQHATLLGVYLHGRTADIAVDKTGYESFIASDIIENLGKAFLEFKSLNEGNLRSG
ncbi:MAG TPA: NAD(P)H-hydrate dehydratase [Flavobacterium sp.]|nr:NAD(P)H-hydrate dehydratase [Flavobacterium sp.]